MKRFFAKRTVLVACFLLALLFVVRVPAWRLRNRALASIAAAVGRNVEVGALRLRFLPRPGFELNDFVIHDDPAFGAEPLVRASEVTASLQLSALLRGRIGIATLSFSDASVNLAQNTAKQWNFVDLLQRTSRSSVAPTASHRSSRQFPYIEATRARINFKTGAEKTHFAFTEAEFALWQDSDNTWGVRLRARPIRTDANLTDTGTINVIGSWQRSAALYETPLDFSFEWKQAQIGQVSNLIYGVDKGWRGNAGLTGTVQGTPENLKVTLNTSLDDFRRQDVLGGGDLRIRAHCTAAVNVLAKATTNLDCIAPSGGGSLQLTGKASVDTPSTLQLSNYDLRLIASNVPAQAVLAFAREVGPKFARDVSAEGVAAAEITLSHSQGNARHVAGGGHLELLRLVSAAGNEVVLGKVPFSVYSERTHVDVGQHGRYKKSASAQMNTQTRFPLSEEDGAFVEVGPVSIATAKNGSLQLDAQLFKSGYRASLRGVVAVRRLLQSAQVLALPAPPVNADGSSTVDLNVAGTWRGERSEVLGTAQLRSVYAQVRGLNTPLVISKADLILGEDSVKVQNLTASAAGATWHGSLRIPRPCVAPADCEFLFNLHSAELRSASLNAFFNPALRKQSWYRFLAFGDAKPNFLLQMRTRGTIAIDNLQLGAVPCSHFSSELQLDKGRVSLSGLQGELLGGNISGDWDANFNSKPPVYRGTGKLDDVSLASISDLMQNQWIDGTGSASYEVTASGWSLSDLLDSADLNADFSMLDGSFPRVILTTKSGPLRVEKLSGNAQLHDRSLALQDTKLETGDAVYSVAGTASLDGALNFKVSGTGTAGFVVSGNIRETQVSANPTTAASLKP